MKNLFIVVLLTISSTAYSSGSWAPEDIKQGFNADTLKDSEKLISAVGKLPEEIIAEYNPGILKDPAILLSIMGHVYGVHSTLFTLQKYELISENICIPRQLTTDGIMHALNKIDGYGFPGSNGLGKGFMVTALIESYQCDEDNLAEHKAIDEYFPEAKFDKLKTIISNFEKHISADDYTFGVIKTLLLAQDYGVLDNSICIPERFTQREMMDTLNEFDTSDFSETNVGGIEFIFDTLNEKYHC